MNVCLLILQNEAELYRLYVVGRASEKPFSGNWYWRLLDTNPYEEFEDPSKPTRVLMMAGMTGSGKSLMINNIVNFLYGVNCEDSFRFKLILENDELKDRSDGTSSMADSMTR